MVKKKYKPSVQETVQPNLIPMVDIMFLLLLFFILGADMTQREMADLVLPNADMVKENDPTKGKDRQLIVNVQHRDDKCPINAAGNVCREQDHWTIVIRGHEMAQPEAKAFIKEEADQALEPDVDPVAGVQLSGLKVVIRGDRLAPYGDVNRVVELCSAAKVYKIEVGAAQPPKD